MKKVNILAVTLMAAGIAVFSLSCGSSSSSGGGGGNPQGSLNSLPNANLTVSNVGGAATQALDTANTQPPSDVSTITDSTVSGAQNQTIPTLSYLFSKLSANNIVINPQSMRGTALNALTVLKQAVASGTCSPTSYVDNSTPGTLDVTVAWNNASCTFSTETLTINGSVKVTGSYDASLGNLGITESVSLNFGMVDSASGLNENITLSGNDTITGSGIIAGTSSISYNEKGTVNINGTVSTPQGGGSFAGWITIDDTFTGTPSQLTFSINDGTEVDVNGTRVLGTYGVANITMTIGAGSPATVTVNGSGTYGEAVNAGIYAYSGKVSVAYDNLLFDPSVCYGYPSSGTITITAANVWLFDFNGASCGCASLSEDGTVVNANFCSF